jgi:hypothetical protein
LYHHHALEEEGGKEEQVRDERRMIRSGNRRWEKDGTNELSK